MVSYGNCLLSVGHVGSEVPQRSVLGPLFHITYTIDFATCVKQFSVYTFASDNQLMLSFRQYHIRIANNNFLIPFYSFFSKTQSSACVAILFHENFSGANLKIVLENRDVSE